VPGRVYLTRQISEPGPTLVAEAADDLELNPEDRPPTRAELLKAVRDKDGILCLLTDAIDAEVLDAARGCRIVANMAVGYNNIDIVAATQRGVLVTNTPGVLTEATADLTWALILAVTRRVVEGDHVMRSGGYSGWGPMFMLGGDLNGRRLGLVGPGRIAEAVARRALAFGMTLQYAGRRPSPAFEALGAQPVELDTLLTTSDVVSLHVPLTAETRHLIDDRAISLMKPTAYLINTARGPVVDEPALVAALKAGRIAGAGLDVYEREPAMAEGLADCRNAVLLPHLGSATVGTRSAMARIAAENLAAALRGERPPNLVNPDAWDKRHSG